MFVLLHLSNPLFVVPQAQRVGPSLSLPLSQVSPPCPLFALRLLCAGRVVECCLLCVCVA